MGTPGGVTGCQPHPAVRTAPLHCHVCPPSLHRFLPGGVWEGWGQHDTVTVTPRNCSPGMSHSPLAPTLLPPMRSVGMGISGSPPPQNLGGQQWGWGLINDGGAVNYRGFFL